MKTEKTLFDTFNEFMMFAEPYEKAEPDQVVTFMENIGAHFCELDSDVLDKYKAYLKNQIDHDRARGADERASVSECLSEGFE